MEDKDKKIPGISDTATNVANAIGTRLSADIPKPEVPEAPIPQVNTLNESELRNELDYKNNIPQTKIDTTVGRPTDADIKAEGVRLVNEGNARIAEAKEKYQEEQEKKHRKAEKMWSAIGDGISAIANMATVGAGADSMYNPADSLHSKVKSKWDEIKANKAAVAAANRKAQMDLLLKDLELGARAKEAEANRNFNIWKTETEEAGRNQRAKEDQEFKSSEKQKDRDNDKEVAKIRGKYSRSSGGGSSSTGKYYYNGKAYKSESERNQQILRDAKRYGVDTRDDDDKLRDWDDLAVELEELIAQGEPDMQPVAGNIANRWGNMFGKTSTTPKPNNNAQPKSTENKKSTMSIYG